MLCVCVIEATYLTQVCQHSHIQIVYRENANKVYDNITFINICSVQILANASY